MTTVSIVYNDVNELKGIRSYASKTDISAELGSVEFDVVDSFLSSASGQRNGFINSHSTDDSATVGNYLIIFDCRSSVEDVVGRVACYICSF